MADRTLGGLFSADAPAAEGGSNGASAGFDGGLQVDPIAEGSCLRHAHTAALTVPVGRWSDCTYFVPPPITAATNNAAVVTVNTTRATPFMVERPCLLAAVYLYVSALSGASAVFRAALHRYQPDSPASTVVVSDRGNQAIAGGGVQGWSFGGAGRIPLQPDVMYLWAFAPHLNGSASVNVQTYGQPSGNSVTPLGHLRALNTPPTSGDFIFNSPANAAAFNCGSQNVDAPLTLGAPGTGQSNSPIYIMKFERST